VGHFLRYFLRACLKTPSEVRLQAFLWINSLYIVNHYLDFILTTQTPQRYSVVFLKRPAFVWRLNVMKFFLCVIGMVMIIEGIPYFGFPDKMKQMMQKILTLPDDVLRKFGLVLMLVGLVLVYLGKME